MLDIIKKNMTAYKMSNEALQEVENVLPAGTYIIIDGTASETTILVPRRIFLELMGLSNYTHIELEIE